VHLHHAPLQVAVLLPHSEEFALQLRDLVLELADEADARNVIAGR